MIIEHVEVYMGIITAKGFGEFLYRGVCFSIVEIFLRNFFARFWGMTDYYSLNIGGVIGNILYYLL